ncbi:MAG: VCBS repeat-containing protein, partial [Planctomycetaceae bacterium]|nr:VCBS repeat-containing protein [Planctomycetaceae bacterium]
PNLGAGTSLREAILTANRSAVATTIRFAANLASQVITLGIAGIDEDAGLTGDLDITQNMTIEGLSPDQLISIDGAMLDRVFDVHGVDFTLSNVSVTGGTASGFGGSDAGGAVRNNEGNLMVSHSRFSGNESGFGGAIYSSGSDTVVTIRHSTIDGNQAFVGGGIAMLAGTLEIDSSTISNNRASTDGGGLQSRSALVTIHQTTISGNQAMDGNGGGIYLLGSIGGLTISQSTIFGNSVKATQTGGGISTNFDARLTLSGSIVGGNYAGTVDTPSDLDVVSLEVGSSYNLIADAATAGGLTDGVDGNFVGVDISTVLDPVLSDNGGPTATHMLLEGSPAINVGDPALTDINLVDQRGPGFFRVWGGRIDLGAVELFPPLTNTILVTTAVDENDGNTDPARGQGTSLREAIIAANSNSDQTTILFDASLDGTPIVLTIIGKGENAALTGDLDILEDTIIQGNGVNSTIIDGNDSDRIFELFSGKTLLIDSAKVMNGNETNGGAISSTGDLTLQNSVFEGNTASTGGVVYATTGQLNVYGSSLTGNSAAFGGVASLSGASTTLVVDSSFISGNTASSYGGVFRLSSLTSSTNRIINSTIAANESGGQGGAIYSSVSNLVIENSTIAFNESESQGGAIYSFVSDFNIVNSTIALNHARISNTGTIVSGGGIYLSSSSSDFQIDNSVIAGNKSSTSASPDDVRGIFETSSSNNLIGDPSTSGGLTNGVKGNIVGVDAADVLESTLADNGGPTQTLALLPGSVAINAGNQDLTTSLTDQRGAGFERVVAGQVDIGAFEFRDFDFGDAPDSYQTLVASDGPWHIVTGPQLGAGVSTELDAPADNGADTFDDGVTFGTADQGRMAQVSVEIAGGNGQARVYGWVDFNQDGKFDGVGEQILDSSVLLADGSHDLNFAVPAGAVVGETQARIRVSTEQGLSWSGGARDGEVEDLLATIGESNLVNLSVSTTEQSEHDPMEITVTATSTLPVVGNQTVELNLSGSATLDKDYAISGIVITILDGQTTGSVTITLKEDVLPEVEEEIQLELTNPSAGIGIGSVNVATITILDATLTPNGAFTGLIGFANGQFELSIPDENGEYAAPKFAATSPGSGILDVKYGDFNGDGFEDIAVWLDNGEWHVGLATGRGNFLFSYWGTWRTTGVKEAQVGDFNGDGKDDLAGLFQNTNDARKGRWWVSVSDGESFTNEHWGDYGNYDGIAAVLVGNFDGVNGDDLVVVATTGQIWMAKTESNSFRYLRCHRWNLGIGFDFMQAGDYNGDGKTDLFTVLGTGLNRLVFVATSLGPTLGFSNGLWSTWKVNQSLDQVLTGDFNGDGADDVIGVFNGSKLWHGYADGEKFRMKYWLNWSDIAGGTTNLLVGQTNNDHLADILARTNDGLWRTAESTGTGLTTRTLVQWSTSTSWDYVGAGVFSQHTIPTAQSVTELSIGSSNPEESAGQVNVERWQPAAEETGSPAAPVSTGSAATTDSAGVEGTESEFELFGDESLLNLLFRA